MELIHLIWLASSIIFWMITRQTIKSMIRSYNGQFYSTCSAILHSTIATVSAFYMLLNEASNGQMIIFFHCLSLGYFILDTYHSSNDFLFVIHHIASIWSIISNYYMHNQQYSYYANLLLLTAEVTGPLQNGFFAMKTVYGENRKNEFNQKYVNLFKFYSWLFFFCRLIVAPILTFQFLSIINETSYFYTISILSSSIILGSAFWIKGQSKMLKRMIKNDVKSTQ